MNYVESINLSWNEVTEKCLKVVWKNIWPDLRKGGNTGHSSDMNEIVEQIVELAMQISLDEVNVDVEEIVQEAAASLSNDELKELVDQEEHKNIESSDSEEKQKKTFAFLKTSLITKTEIFDQFIENDPNFDRISKARRGC
ncbi:uncharacterized protein TNCT_174121 [Trichonephila clavata]|uniref:Uncharacterized protein n=1 Tax=Trichonephila clavata TaxID=2740835 RepID=A0A8X6EXF2_TRICU|nr:uncharacterized protein TNCT_174121 [Trichonephila clavata]